MVLPLPLSSLRVIDFSRYIAGPFCASILADLGAEVIRIEPVAGGEDRGLVPLGDAPDGALFMQMNRNKKSLAINTKTNEGRDLVERLISSADVVVTNMPVDTLRQNALDRISLQRLRPNIITVNISAFGPTGRLSERTGFDAIGQALSGAAYLAGTEGAPARSSSSYVDYGTGLAGAIGVLAALIQRDATGKGQDVQASLLATALTFINVAHIEEAVLGLKREPFGNRSPHSGPSDFFRTKDGTIAVQVVGERMFARWAKLIGRTDFLQDGRFKDDASRGRYGEHLSLAMREWTLKRTTVEALQALADAGIPAGPIYSPEQVVSDELVAETGILGKIGYPGLAAAAPLAELIVRLADRDTSIRSRAPLVGEHTDEILRGLGVADAEIERLRRSGIVASTELRLSARSAG